MGVGWRRFMEHFKQSTSMSKSFAPTSNLRNERMLSEAGDFAKHLKEVIRDVGGMSNSYTSLSNTLSKTLNCDLPRTYEESAAPPSPAVQEAMAGATPGTPPPVPQGLRVVPGTELIPQSEALKCADLDGEELARLSHEHTERLEREVLAPMRAWLDAYNSLKTKNKELEAMRLEVDSRRRTVADLTLKEASARAALLKGATPKREKKLSESADKLRHKVDKLHVSAGAYTNSEENLHTELAALIQDCVYVSQYAANALKLHADVLVASSTLVRAPEGGARAPVKQGQASAQNVQAARALAAPRSAEAMKAPAPAVPPPPPAGAGTGEFVTPVKGVQPAQLGDPALSAGAPETPGGYGNPTTFDHSPVAA